MAIKHILADGSEIQDITGHIVKSNEAAEFYKLVDNLNRRRDNDKNSK